MKQVSDQEVKDLVKSSNKLVIVDLFATWCGPCKALTPKLEELSKEHSEKVEVVKVDVDEHQAIASENNVRGVPTMLFFKNGQLVQTMVGNHPKDDIEKIIKANS